jgi:hypothetical protein
MRLSSRVGALFWLGLLMAPLAALTGSVARADAPREIFGAHWIERVPGKNSYILRLSAGDGGSTGFIALRCIADEQALTVQIGAPNGANRMQPRQTVTVWSDKTPAVDVVVGGDPSGAYGIAVMNEQAGVEADASFMTLFETVIGAEDHISYSIGADAVTVDAAQLQPARARFAALCARPDAPRAEPP